MSVWQVKIKWHDNNGKSSNGVLDTFNDDPDSVACKIVNHLGLDTGDYATFGHLKWDFSLKCFRVIQYDMDVYDDFICYTPIVCEGIHQRRFKNTISRY